MGEIMEIVFCKTEFKKLPLKIPLGRNMERQNVQVIVKKASLPVCKMGVETLMIRRLLWKTSSIASIPSTKLFKIWMNKEKSFPKLPIHSVYSCIV